MTAVKRAKQIVANTLRATGALRAVGASKWRGNRLLVLGYHGVSLDDEHLFDPELFMSPDVFSSRMEQLRQLDAAVLPLAEALDRLRSGTLPMRAVALTFDDGFCDFHRVVWPILRRFGFPATVYQTTYYAEYAEPVCHLAWRYILWRARGQRLDWARVIGQQGSLDLALPGARGRAFEALDRFAEDHALRGPGKDGLARALAAELSVDYEDLRQKRTLALMTPAEIREVSDAGVSVELHTHRHRTPLDRKLFLREIDDNRAWIEQITRRTATHFCYPSGRWHPAFFPWLAERNIASATTCDPGMAAPSSTRYLIPRLIDTSALTPIEFEAWVAGPGALLCRSSTPDLVQLESPSQ